MAESTKKRTGELQRGVFKILLNESDGLPVKEVLRRLEIEIPLNSFESSFYPNRPSIRRFDKIVRFATIASVKAGWLEKSRGRWRLTDKGIDAYKKHSDPEKFKSESDRQYLAWANANKDASPDEPASLNESAALSISLENAIEQAWDEIESFVQKIDPYDFQNKLVAGLLKGMGYHVAHAAPPGADGGIDIVAYKDPLGLDDPTLKVSVRRRVQKADVKDLREFLSLLHGHDVGIFVSVSGFTSEAEKSSRTEQRKVRLIDLEKLFDLWVKNYSSIPEDERNVLPVKPVWFLSRTET